MISAFERTVAFRYLRARRREGFISVTAGFWLAGIALGVAALIIVMSVQITEDRGDTDRLSEGQRQLARHCAMLSVECEAMESSRAAGGKLDLETYIPAVNALARALGRRGLNRVAAFS